MVEDPNRLYSDRYNFLQEEHGVGFGHEIHPDAGRFCRVDIGFKGGEQVAIDNSWHLEVLHVPGHSKGHLALYDAAHKSAYVSDAIHGHGCPKADGGMGIPVTYFYIDLYLSTLTHMEGFDLEHLHTGHWPSMQGEEIRDFFSDSRNTVARLDRKILGSLNQSRRGMTLSELMDASLEEFPEWPADTRALSSFPIKGHLDQLEARRQVQFDPGCSPPRWRIA
jgi:glyoxylase-like metal-dependent hydrolase (beta-lactamase superfamily II)